MRTPASTIVDIVAEVTPLSVYWFLGVAGTVTMSGYFLNAFGVRTGASFTSTAITIADGSHNPKGFADVFGAAIPTDAVGFAGEISGDVYVDMSKNSTATYDSDFKTNYVNYPRIAATTLLTLGRVA